MQPKTFFFEHYRFDAATGELRLCYAFDNGMSFEEVITFKPPFDAYNPVTTDKLFRLLFLMAGVSYYKAYVPPQLVCKAFPLDDETARWMEKLYLHGLGEFSYKNGLDLRGRIHFVSQDMERQLANNPDYRTYKRKVLVPIGGGKDSVVTLEALRQAGFDVACFALGGPADAAEPIANCIRVSGLPSVYVTRVIAPELIRLNGQGVYNGHVPITAILSVIALVAAELYGYGAVVMSNEHSASAPNMTVGDFDINHQYSKSFDFECDLNSYLKNHITRDLEYFSLLRPLSEIDISRRFAKLDAYHSVFRSCNTAFRQDAASRGTHWCCNCPKCRFVFLAMAPFMGKEKLLRIFGHNMLDDEKQIEGFAELCGVSAYKPFECVGEIAESASAIANLAGRNEWQRDKVIQDLSTKIQGGSLEAHFARYRDHAVPSRYLPALGFDHAKVVIWGTGKEGHAAEVFINRYWTPKSVTFVDEGKSLDANVISDPQAIQGVIAEADILIKSPGVSLYHPFLKGVSVTSLLNIWWPYRPSGKTICITGTKGKSTTSALLGHVLGRMGYKAAVLGNIGVPVTEAPSGMDYIVLELSSYQIANFEGVCDVAAVTSLYPEHLNWHGDLKTYYKDKLRLLDHARVSIVQEQVIEAGYKAKIGDIVCGRASDVPNSYLARVHNLANVGVVLAVVKSLGLDEEKARAAMADFKGLPHRQQELGEQNGILFVDDSIATTPQAAIAAMDVYQGKPITLVAGGYDRGIDYGPLVEYVLENAVHAVVTLGPSGQRIREALMAKGYKSVFEAKDMAEVLGVSQRHTPAGGVVLLSPAAPSFGLFQDYIERGRAFAKAAGF